MTPATQKAYRGLAEHFYATRLNGQPPSPKRLSDALRAVAGDYRPAYWRRLRNALAYDQRERGFAEAAERIEATKNPVTREGSTEAVKPKQTRAKRVTEADEAKLMAHFSALNDPITTAALFVAKYTGARPAEFAGMQVIEGKVFVPGAKRSHGGTRGADRLIELSPAVVNAIGQALPYLQGDIGPTQDRIRAAAKKLWPQRKALPSLYSFRHQMGSDLKASGLDRRAVAYLMGHQATESVNVYGNSRTARGGRSLPKVPEGTDLAPIRDTAKQPPVAAAAAPANARFATRDLPQGAAAQIGKLLSNGGAGLRVSTEKFAKCQEVSGLKLEK
jgi:hypothetical protein